MQKTILKTLLSLGLLAFAFSANAKWYTSNGIGTTRDEAVNDALENIMMQSGADVKLLQVYKNGALQSEDFQLRAQNPVKKIEVVEMQTTLNKVSVTLKAFIDDEKLTKSKPLMNVITAVKLMTFTPIRPKMTARLLRLQNTPLLLRVIK